LEEVVGVGRDLGAAVSFGLDQQRVSVDDACVGGHRGVVFGLLGVSGSEAPLDAGDSLVEPGGSGR
jgi:hypothetical protein